MEIWNNPSCSKCAAARSALDEAGVGYGVRPYLDRPPSAAELTEVLRRLGARPWDVCRTQEPAAVALGMADWPRDEASESRWIDAMVAAPELIQRPLLLLDDGSALVGRTPEAVAEAVRRSGVTAGGGAEPGPPRPTNG
ncbi:MULTISPECIES: ArsC/Spx/MgsR family protein [unclassified Micromonospora]|uniref:ArsC/Spx/MgsR family protein n=1 Tax=unclassified Micromonospora TaxID=2617518 RepID=UPI003320A0C3